MPRIQDGTLFEKALAVESAFLDELCAELELKEEHPLPVEDEP